MEYTVVIIDSDMEKIDELARELPESFQMYPAMSMEEVEKYEEKLGHIDFYITTNRNVLEEE